MSNTPQNYEDFLLIRYRDISEEARNNVKKQWSVVTLFITASFALTAFFFKETPDNNRFSFILAILALFWFAMFYNVTWNIANGILLKLRDNIVKKYELKTYRDYANKFPKRIKPSYIFFPFAICYHGIFIHYSNEELTSENTDFLLILLLIFAIILGFLTFYEWFVGKELQEL